MGWSKTTASMRREGLRDLELKAQLLRLEGSTMKITVKSTPENWGKEKSGIKPNTLRELDGSDTIEVVSTVTGETFTRTITDITVWKGQLIISWKPEADHG